MKAQVDEAYRTGDTVGGVFEVVAHGCPAGLGSHIASGSANHRKAHGRGINKRKL